MKSSRNQRAADALTAIGAFPAAGNLISLNKLQEAIHVARRKSECNNDQASNYRLLNNLGEQIIYQIQIISQQQGDAVSDNMNCLLKHAAIVVAGPSNGGMITYQESIKQIGMIASHYQTTNHTKLLSGLLFYLLGAALLMLSGIGAAIAAGWVVPSFALASLLLGKSVVGISASMGAMGALSMTSGMLMFGAARQKEPIYDCLNGLREQANIIVQSQKTVK